MEKEDYFLSGEYDKYAMGVDEVLVGKTIPLKSSFNLLH